MVEVNKLVAELHSAERRAYLAEAALTEVTARAERAEAERDALGESLRREARYKAIAERDAKSAEDRAERAEAALKECADDLEEELRARYEMGPDKKVYMQARFDRDMQPVFNARAVLAQFTDQKEN